MVVILAVLAFAAGVTLGFLHGTSKRLPGVALGWPFFLQVERGAAAAALIAVFAVVLLQLWRDDLPSELPFGVKWAAADSATTRNVQEQLLRVEQQSKIAFDELHRAVTELARHVPSARIATQPLALAADRWESGLADAAARDQVAQAVAGLPEREKLMIALYYYENLSLHTVANILGVDKSWAVRLRRKALQDISEALDVADPEPLLRHVAEGSRSDRD